MRFQVKVNGHRLLITFGGKNWRSKPHPYWFRRKGTIQSGPFEVFWR